MPKKHRKIRQQVFARDGYTCRYCGRILSQFPPEASEVSARNQPTLDHVIPKSKGGEHTLENLVTACGKCNHRKADKIK